MDNDTFVVPTNKAEALSLSAADLFGMIWYDSSNPAKWTALSEEDQVAFRECVKAYTDAASTLRSKFDAVVTMGHADGSISVKVENIRKPWNSEDGKTRGRKAQPKSMEDLLLK